MSLRRAINEKCRDCICDPKAPGTWRKQVEDCRITGCSLWAYRPRTTTAAPTSSVQDWPILGQKRELA